MMTEDTRAQHLPAAAGFWRRVAAIFLDSLFLGLFGWVLGLIATNALVALGPWGRLFGFFVAFSYFTVLDSHLGHGQSLGKRVMAIRVLRSTGQLLSPRQAGLRFVPVGLAWFLNGAALPPSVVNSWLTYPLSAVIFGLLFCQFFLLVFNRPHRQMVHDLWMSTVVVPSDHRGATHPTPLSNIKLAICAGLVVASGLAPLGIGRWANLQQADLNALQPVHDAVAALPGVTQVQVGIGEGFSQTVQTGRRSWTYLSVRVASSTPNVQVRERLQAMARAALQAYPAGQQRDVLSVRLCYGYDIGIAILENCEYRNASPAEWLAGS